MVWTRKYKKVFAYMLRVSSYKGINKGITNILL